MNLLQTIENQFKKPAVVSVKSGDTVRVHQRIREGSRERVQVFEGLVIRVDRKRSLTYRITVRRIASGVGVEKGFMMHSPNIVRVEVTKRAKVRRNYISYIRQRRGKAARLRGLGFDPGSVNLPPETEPPAKAGKTDQPETDAADGQAKADEASQPEADASEPPADGQAEAGTPEPEAEAAGADNQTDNPDKASEAPADKDQSGQPEAAEKNDDQDRPADEAGAGKTA